MAAGPSSTKSVKLVLGDETVEVAASIDAGLEALNTEAVAKFGLQPDSFSIHDDFGKVHEAPEWKKMREMEEKINMLIARCPVVDSVMQNLEERSARRFDKLASALQDVEQRSISRDRLVQQSLEDLDKKVTNSIAPLLKCVTLQEMELKAKLDTLSASMTSQETESKINCSIAPMLQSMALQQMDLKEKLDSFEASPACHSCEKLAVKVDEVEEITKDLQKEMDLSSNNLQKTSQQLKALQAEVHHIAETPTKGGDASIIMSAMRQDLMMSPKTGRNSLGGSRGDDWNEGSSNDIFSPIVYSKKAALSNNMNLGGAGAMPFARSSAPRQLDRLQSSRSLPHLPPMWN